MRSVFHILAESDWQAARTAGSYAPASLAAEGFVHFSYRHQVARTANARYRDRNGLIVVEFDADGFPGPLVDEDLYGAGEDFPHLYAAVPVIAALAEHPLPRRDNGDFDF
jgi:uncharacterized protein (DUF952 family)